MQIHEVQPGLKFRDTGLSQPPEYQVHIVTDDDADGFDARHVASGNVRRFDKTKEATGHLEVIGSAPVMVANLDHLVGERVRIELTMGSSVRGTVTAVRYQEVDIVGHTLRFVREIELDKSGGSAYPLHEIVKVQSVPR